MKRDRNKIRVMRKKVRDKKWLTKRLNDLLDESERWNNFETFDCNSFFKGYDKAKHNLALHKRGSHRTSRQIEFIQSLLKQPSTSSGK